MSSAPKVVVRLRPCDAAAMRYDDTHVRIKQKNSQLTFSVDAVYDGSTTQEALFDAECGPLVDAAKRGESGIILAYGQTGAGKSHTVLGGGTTATRGLVPRALERIFSKEEVRRIQVSFLEIYNDHIVDLLATFDGKEQWRPLKQNLVVRDHDDGSVSVKGLTLAPAATAAEALHLLDEAEINRAVASHALNVASSRSHFVATIYLRSSKLHIVDLAGSERVKVTSDVTTTKATLREAGYINKSLSFLEQVVVALGDKVRDHVPYRSSKLTHFLKDALGKARTSLIACVWPSLDHADQTRATLRFAGRMRRIPPINLLDDDESGFLDDDDWDDDDDDESHVSADEPRQPQTRRLMIRTEEPPRRRYRIARHRKVVGALKRQIANLRDELAARDLIAKDVPDYARGALKDADLERAKQTAKDYAQGGPVPPVVTVAQVHTVFAALRDLIITTKDDTSPPVEEPRRRRKPQTTPSEDRLPSIAPPPQRTTADPPTFERWRRKNGGAANAALERVKEEQKQAASVAKAAAADVNAAKRAIDALLARIDVATETTALQRRLKEVKAEYRGAYTDLDKAKTQLKHLDTQKKDLASKLVAEYMATQDDGPQITLPRGEEEDESKGTYVLVTR